DDRAGGLGGRFGAIEVAGRDQVALEERALALELPAGLALGALRPNDVGAHGGDRGTLGLERGARLVDRGVGRADRDDGGLERGARLAALGAGRLARERPIRAPGEP